ncbi:MAG: trypsin-like serine protease, partial [Methylophilaceae bacterium]
PNKVSIVRGTGKGLKAIKVASHPTYRPNSGIGHDIAVLVFKEQSSEFYIPVALTQAQAGDPLTIIGFGKFDHLNGRSGGTKRMGTNKVSAIDYQGRVDFIGLVSPLNNEGTGESVTNSQGDSGGPMIIKSRVQGVSSSVSKGANNKNVGHY